MNLISSRISPVRASSHAMSVRPVEGPVIMQHQPRVLIVSTSPINCVVVSRIVERVGLRTVASGPADAVRDLRSLKPIAVVLDAGPGNRDCDEVVGAIASFRRDPAASRLIVVMISTRGGGCGGPSLAGMIDAVVQKPITTEVFQPIIEDLLGHLRG